MHQDPSFEKFLCNCMIPPKESQNLIEESSTEESLQVSAAASVHEGKKPFKCESCDYSCSLKGHLNQHVASVHEGKKPFKCKTCNHSFSEKGSLKKHVAAIHDKKKH